jgi:hypothetical protein
MQSELETKAITKRTKDTTLNGKKVYGVTDNQVKGNNADDEYNINGDDAKKGGNSDGSLVDHLYKLDMSTGGDVEDQKARTKQLGYTIAGINKYTVDSSYSDADIGDCEDVNYGKINTDLNVGQVVIY